ncbi:hypothetical protein PR202_gb15627 [Eleusine coracana subsp. coracana]|uniref:Uncharacterized protein n=1 Tax=Eleusine coracana subsp. coracana TaxID=191504 RepID=A0AAV5EYS8_ELECO|nr:hypothetical protein PR202_gb15627 [Eleusine coracana subsp. coracana]
MRKGEGVPPLQAADHGEQLQHLGRRQLAHRRRRPRTQPGARSSGQDPARSAQSPDPVAASGCRVWNSRRGRDSLDPVRGGRASATRGGGGARRHAGRRRRGVAAACGGGWPRRHVERRGAAEECRPRCWRVGRRRSCAGEERVRAAAHGRRGLRRRRSPVGISRATHEGRGRRGARHGGKRESEEIREEGKREWKKKRDVRG